MDFTSRSAFQKALFFVVGMLVVYLISYFFYTGNDKCKPCGTSHVKANNRLLGFTRYTDSEKIQFMSLVARKALSHDSELVKFVRKVIDPPPPSAMLKLTKPFVTTAQASEIDKLLGHQLKGFFVEAGALDGETASNSIFFERTNKWTGLLVEPDPYFYTQLVGKNRACWSINACLSTSPYVTEMSFQESHGGLGKLVKDAPMKVPCFPLETILLALNVKTVDYFSLDVEGFELEVLKTLPETGKNLINIRSLSVEYLHGIQGDYKPYMASKGYTLAKELHFLSPTVHVDDFIFIKNSSTV